ncbi:single-stranded DNA-binding protein [Microbacterium lacticum]
MALHTQQSLSGFIATEPERSVTENGDTRFYARIGQRHFHREEDGTFTELEPSFHNLVAYRATAERALARFAKDDSFLAEGYVHSYPVERAGQTVEIEEFVAKKIGHDLARTTYEVDRTRRSHTPAEREAGTHPAAQQAAPAAVGRRRSAAAASAPSL